MPSEMKAPAIAHLAPFEALFNIPGPVRMRVAALHLFHLPVCDTESLNIVDIDKSAPKIVVSEPTQ
jgi:hypothetical protein